MGLMEKILEPFNRRMASHWLVELFSRKANGWANNNWVATVVRLKQTIRAVSWRIALSPAVVRWLDSRKQSLSLGPRGELAAERALLRQGYIILHRGYEDKFGEIDLIAVDQRTIVFVEVKTRTTDQAGTPEEAVDANKESHLTRTAVGFLKWHRMTEYAARFDVVAIVWPDTDTDPEIRHHVNAFAPVGEFQIFA